MSTLGIYPYDFSANLQDSLAGTKFDSEGIPLQYMKGLGYRYYWITISRYAIAQHALFLRTADQKHRDLFLRICRWLSERAETCPHEGMVWYHYFGQPFYKLTSPWLSGMAQSRSVSIFLRAWELTDDEKYIQYAQKASVPFMYMVPEGGVAAHFPDGTLGFEEWGTPTPSLSLNGFMASIIGIDELCQIMNDQKSQRLLDNALEGLNSNLKEYDTGYWTLYDLWRPRRLASRNYHQVHLDWLAIFFRRWKDPLYDETASRWRRYQSSPMSHTKWFIHKAYQKLTVRGILYTDLEREHP
jgi:hypothetical protein